MSDSTPPLRPLPIVPRVLILEDNAPYRELMTEFLTMSGFEICACPDGRKVTSILAERPIDLVITDLRYSHPKLPIIAISGDVPLNRNLYLTLAEKLGACRVLAKPFKMGELVAAAHEALAASTA